VIYQGAVRGTGRLEIAAAGIADAEHQLARIVERFCPGCRLTVLEIRRALGESRIAEHFRLYYRLEMGFSIESISPVEARRTAFRHARARAEDTELKMVEWEEVVLREGTTGAVEA
jgi:hypothetical protein